MKKVLCAMLAMVILLGLNVFALPIAAADNDDVIVFSDPVLEVLVRKQIGKMEGDITVGDAKQTEELDLHNDSSEDPMIRDISALSYFGNLFKVNLYNNEIEDISALAGLENLKYLDLGCNRIEDISPLAGLPLVELGLSGNRISDLTPLSGLTNLEGLYLNTNRIADFSPIAQLKSLQRLMVGDNET